MKKPEIEITKSVDLLKACEYLEANGWPNAKKLIFDKEVVMVDYRVGLVSIHRVTEDDLKTVTYMPYTREYKDCVDALWDLYPDEDAWTLSWEVT